LESFHNDNNKKGCLETASPDLVDCLGVFSWGKELTYYGVKTNKPIKFGNRVLESPPVYYDEQETFQDFYKFAKIWGLPGNVFFLKNTLISDYKNKLFGIL
jgi:hypothetical protein